MDSLGSLFNKSPRHSVLLWQVEAAMILQYFGELLTHEYAEQAQHVKPISVKDKVLKARTNNSPLGAMIQARQEDFCRRINDHFGKEVVIRIVFST
ncbi:MAG: DUF721 domain-containing protein [Candidatus Komeilibacteria bacterium]|nr:DUF721 domain-containing protein [Candidatus Komeilibacteria bacterium]